MFSQPYTSTFLITPWRIGILDCGDSISCTKAFFFFIYKPYHMKSYLCIFKILQYGSSWAGLSNTVYLKAMSFIKKLWFMHWQITWILFPWVSFFHQRHICSSIFCNLYAFFWKFLLSCLWSLEPSFPHITVFFFSRFASRCIPLRRCYDRRGYCSRGWCLDTVWLRRCTMSSCSN